MPLYNVRPHSGAGSLTCCLHKYASCALVIIDYTDGVQGGAGRGTYSVQYSAVQNSGVQHGAPKRPNGHHTTVIRLNLCHSRPPVTFCSMQWQGRGGGAEPEKEKCFLENCSVKKVGPMNCCDEDGGALFILGYFPWFTGRSGKAWDGSCGARRAVGRHVPQPKIRIQDP